MRLARVSLALVLLVGLAPAAAWAQLTRLPYLQNGSSTAVSIRWRTSATSDSRVWYGPAPGSLTQTVDQATTAREHEVRLSGLAPDTKYFYAIGTSAGMQAGNDANHFFVTAPPRGTARPARIWVLGDPGTGSDEQAEVRDAYYAFTGSRHTDLWLMLGDNAYDESTDGEMQANLFDVYPAMLRKSVLFTTRGNHETATSGGIPWYYRNHTLPTAGEAGGVASGTEAYYAFDYANIHFICLDSFGSNRGAGAAMATWLRSDLDANTQTWTVAFWHHPPYSKGSHDSDSEEELVEMRENINPILEAGGVDLVLSGHSHAYERTYLLDGHYGPSDEFDPAVHVVQPGGGRESGEGPYQKPAQAPAAHAGAVYVVAGNAGQTEEGPLDHPAMFLSLERLGSLVLDVDGNRLQARFLRETGAVDDTFTIVKGPAGPAPPAAPTNLGAAGQDARVSLAWTPAARAATYTLKRAPDPAGPFATIQTALTATTAVDATAVNGTTYAYVVTAVSAEGLESAPSGAASATPIAGGQPPAPLQTATGSASNASTVRSANVTAVANQLYLAAVSTRSRVSVAAVSGLGLTWSRAGAQCGGRGTTGVEVWQARGIPDASGPVTATLAAAAGRAVIAVSRYGNSSGVRAVASANSNGAGGACSGGDDSNAYSLPLTTTVATSVRYGAAALRNRSHTPGSGYSERADLRRGSGSSAAGLAVEDRLFTAPGTAPVDGALSGSTDWAVVGVEIAP
jgi:hypothetical protein